MKKCPKCGKEYPDIKNFCTICKERLTEEDTNKQHAEEQKRLKEKRYKYIAGIIAAVLLIAAFVVFLVPFQYKATQAYCENSTEAYTEYYVGEEPYTDIEAYHETGLYNTTDYVSYKMISTGKGIAKCRSGGSGCYCGGDIGTIQNADNISGKFAVEVSFFSSEQQTQSTKIGSYLSSSYLLNPGESQRVEVSYYKSECDKTKPTYYRIDGVISSTKEVIKNLTITKTRNVTKYKNVTKTREVTKHHSVKKQREITKNATLFGQWTGKAARYEDVNCRVND
ncbi:MAG: hypothetical protein CVT88_01105 [Candidatus Altiarchaeales archaeon HGW-Altiarchaeales-1]|nr:MAG: hypothetical protein CVT88_01105 [Candidatus Altiarchaeales archaeon HGW-Altiarchaeales-1]